MTKLSIQTRLKWSQHLLRIEDIKLKGRDHYGAEEKVGWPRSDRGIPGEEKNN